MTASRNPESNVWGSGFKPPGSRFQRPGSRFQPPDVTFQGPDSNLQGSRCKPPGVHILTLRGPDSNLQGPDLNIQGPVSNFQGPDSNVQGSRFQAPQVYILTPRPNLRFATSLPMVFLELVSGRARCNCASVLVTYPVLPYHTIPVLRPFALPCYTVIQTLVWHVNARIVEWLVCPATPVVRSCVPERFIRGHSVFGL